VKFVLVMLAVVLLSACGQTASDETAQPPTPAVDNEVNADGSLDISSGEDLGLSVEISTPTESASIPPGTVRYEQTRTGNYFVQISGENPVTQLEITIGGSLEPGEYPLEICPSFLDEDYASICMNFTGMGVITRLSDDVQGEIMLETLGDVLSGTLDVEIETPVDGDRVTMSIVAIFDQLSLTDETGE